jgi:glycosyltransferase involved in cell wall biosynthesis
MSGLPRVVLLANSVEELGGAQRVVHLVAQGLAERGYPVELVGLAPADAPHAYVVDPAYRQRTLMPQPWPAPPPDARLTTRLRPSVRRLIATRTALSAAAVADLQDLLADGPPGVIVVAQLWAMEHLARAVHDGWRVVGQYHSSFEAAVSGRDLSRALDLYADVDAVALLTAEDADAFRRAGLNNTTVLANPLGLWPDEPADATAGRTVTFLGRLSAEKGPRFLVDAWGQAAARHPDWRLRFVGSGPDEAAIRARVDRLAVGADRVDFVAAVADVEPELRAAGILALPSLTEGLPMSLAEAMAMGLATVSADCSAGVRALADEGAAGMLVPRGDAGALAGALDDLLSDPSKRARLGAAARAHVERYRLPAVLDAWEQLFAETLR